MIMIGGRCLSTCGCRLISSVHPPLFSSFCRRKSKVLFSPCRNVRIICSTSEAKKKKKKNKVIVISGPTGSGKSRLALELAKRINGEIISADSVQVYKGLDIGSAKPSTSERKEVPHHLLDILQPSEEYSAGRFFEDARKATENIVENCKVPIVVGGTGLYLRWYIYGKPDVPVASANVASEASSELENFEKNGQWDAAVELVANAGDAKARSVPQNDWYRLRRSLEIIKSSGSPPSAFLVPYDAFRGQQIPRAVDSTCDLVDDGNTTDDKLAKDLDYDFLCFFLSTPRVNLYRSIDMRCEEMLMTNPGILTEASWLLDSGLLPNSNSATRAIGYRQSMEYLQHCREVNGRCSPGDFYSFLTEFQQASRNFAKRQMTWFRNELIYHWLDASKALEKVLSFIHDSYQDECENVIVPEFLRMRKDVTGRRENIELKMYRPVNKLFTSKEDCSYILDWIRRTQSQ